jgi:hypothetical protein
MPDEYGPEILALTERARRLTLSELTALADAWSAAWDVAAAAALVAAWDAVDAAQDPRSVAGPAAWDAVDAARDAWAAARDATWDSYSAARDATWAAAMALVFRDQLDRTAYDVLTGPWARVIGRVHPDDPDRRSPDA